MSNQNTGMTAMFPIYLARHPDHESSRDEYDNLVAQNEVNLNQNLETLYQKILDLEEALSES